jgi:hypothetical protein
VSGYLQNGYVCMSVLDFSVVVKCVRLLTEWLCYNSCIVPLALYSNMMMAS